MQSYTNAHHFGRPGAQRGVALVFALWLVVLLSMIGGSHARNVRLDTKLASNHVGSAKAKLLAESGVSRAILELFVANSALQWRFDGTEYQIESTLGKLRIRIRSAEGLVDLNAASSQVLAALLRTQQIDEETQVSLLDAILDWRDKDDLRRLHGAEDRDYRFAGLPYGTPDRAFAMLDELRYVLGMGPDLFEKIRPYLTLYSGKSGVNPQFAPAELLSALDGGAVDATGGLEGQDDAELDVDPEDALSGSLVNTAVRGVFHITVEAEATNGAAAALEVVVNTASAKGMPYSILSWREVASEIAVEVKES